MKKPIIPNDPEYRFDSFSNNITFAGKKKDRLPAMGWNSWNAFGSDNTEELTKQMSDALVNLKLDKLGYKYVVLDDGCYRSERIDGRVSNEMIKFPSGFKSLADYVHSKGLLFGMYNDIGSRLCAGAWVGTCGHEHEDALSYVEWDIDFLKVDNCYNLWDNATFSDKENARYVYAPAIKDITIEGENFTYEIKAKDACLHGKGAYITDDCVKGIGSLDGTGPDNSPLGQLSSELIVDVKAPYTGEYSICLTYATSREIDMGEWMQIAVGTGKDTKLYYDDFVPETPSSDIFIKLQKITISLKEGNNSIRIMNHRRQENTLYSYGTLYNELKSVSKDKDILLSLCEWGKTNPHIWGYKVGDSWRILNDICFQVGSKDTVGHGDWYSDYTVGIATQYNKCVIMDEFSGRDKGYNDPDMMVIGLDGISIEMSRTHMAMWCMMNSPLMLGMDLRKISIGDEIYNIIANEDLIALNQDSLGIQAKRIYCSKAENNPDTTYVRDIQRYDVLAKPLSDGGVAISVINLSSDTEYENIDVDMEDVVKFIGSKMKDDKAFISASAYSIYDLWTKTTVRTESKKLHFDKIVPYGNITVKITINE